MILLLTCLFQTYDPLRSLLQQSLLSEPRPAAEKVGKQTALDRYVAAPDPTYKFELVKTIQGKDNTAYVIDMTSQTWRTPQEVDKPVWKSLWRTSIAG